ncbi:MAG: DUF190 domain-containing protein [Actinomycetota bacterium]|nr:DUF190 domain-containing protein [Actinomycetota bacterium]MDA8280577.1 DUF190 domain-containing protein [Actinomycetota bacterium]
MTEVRHGCRLLVYTTGDDRVGHHSVWEVLLQRARDEGLSGATVWQGIEGFGATRRLRTTRFPDMARGLPLVVEIVDEPERIDAFLHVVAEVAPDALVTTEPVSTARRQASGPLPFDDTPPYPR